MTLIRSERAKKIEEQKLKLAKRTSQLKDIFSEVCATAEGILAFRYVMEICGYQQVSITGDPATGDIQDRGTLYNEARRNVYLELRKIIPNQFLKKIEFPSVTKQRR